ncbi:MAG: alpha/beta fold hydrolase [Patescibacteria group bacterium]
MKTSLKRIQTDDGIELVGLLYEPENRTDKVLVHVHGMAGNFYENKFLDAIAGTLTSNGIAFFVFNNRGCEYIKDLTKTEGGKKTFVRIGDTYEIFEDSLLDIKSAIDFVSTNRFTKVHLSGHSLGGPKIAYYVAETKDTRLASVVFLSPADMVGLTKADANYDRDRARAQKMVKEGKGKELLPFPVLWDQIPLSAQTYISLNSETSKVAIFNFYDPNDPLPVLGRITIPSLTIMGRKDDALSVSIEETMARIKKAIKNPRVETNILGDANHGYTGDEQALADAILAWIISFSQV